MCLNCISQDLFRDTTHDHIWRAKIFMFGLFGHIWHICAQTEREEKAILVSEGGPFLTLGSGTSIA